MAFSFQAQKYLDSYNMLQTDLMNTMRMLWEQHVMWTRSFIISTAADLPDLKFVENRLMRNPADLGNVFRQYYGAAKAAKFENLIREHLEIAGKYVNAAKTGDKNAPLYRKQWFSNADEIAAFLASINPNWSEQEWKKMLYDHLTLTESEAVDRLKGNFEKDISDYDEIEMQALKMADELSHGIMQQFPNAFKY